MADTYSQEDLEQYITRMVEDEQRDWSAKQTFGVEGSLTFTLDDETEKRLYDLMCDVDTEKTPDFFIHDKYGHTAMYVKGVLCRDCKYHVALYAWDKPALFKCTKFKDFPANEFDHCSYGERRKEE